MTKPPNFIQLEGTCGSCYFMSEISEYCKICKRSEEVGKECRKHKFSLPRFEVFKCRCDDFLEDRD